MKGTPASRANFFTTANLGVYSAARRARLGCCDYCFVLGFIYNFKRPFDVF